MSGANEIHRLSDILFETVGACIFDNEQKKE
jgi:hypothetical protein